MPDTIQFDTITPSAPAFDAATVTPSDSVDLGNATDSSIKGARGLYIGTTGNVAVITHGGTTLTFSNVPVGFFPVACTRVLSTGTTASNIVALY